MDTRVCEECGSVVPKSYKFCPECGVRFGEERVAAVEEASSNNTCSECGEPLEPSDSWCQNCLAPQSKVSAPDPDPPVEARSTPPIVEKPAALFPRWPETTASTPRSSATSSYGASAGASGGYGNESSVPLISLLAVGSIAIGVMAAFAFPAVSVDSFFYGSADFSLKSLMQTINDDGGIAAWPFVLAAIGLAIAVCGVFGAANRTDWFVGALTGGPLLALALPIYIWNELRGGDSEDGSVDLGSGMVIFAFLMLATVALTFVAPKLAGRESGS